MCAQATECVVGKSVPLDCRVKSICAVSVAGTNCLLAAKSVIGSGSQTGAPFGSGIKTYLADNINNCTGRTSFSQYEGIVAIVINDKRILNVGLCNDCGVGAWVSQDKHIATSDRSGQTEALAGNWGAIGVKLQNVIARGKVYGCARPIVESRVLC